MAWQVAAACTRDADATGGHHGGVLSRRILQHLDFTPVSLNTHCGRCGALSPDCRRPSCRAVLSFAKQTLRSHQDCQQLLEASFSPLLHGRSYETRELLPDRSYSFPITVPS